MNSLPSSTAPQPIDPQTPPRAEGSAAAEDGRLSSLLERIQKLTGTENSKATTATKGQALAEEMLKAPTGKAPVTSMAPATRLGDPSILPGREPTGGEKGPFIPMAPATIRESGLTNAQVEMLVLKFLLARGDSSGRDVANQIKLPFVLIDGLMRQMKQDQLVVYRADAPMNDYVYQLTDMGREAARRLAQHCSYFGSAPVPIEQYIESVSRQSLTKQQPGEDDLRRAFSDLLISDRIFVRLGPAINSGRGLFLFGPAGNGKTSIAERVTRAFGTDIWIPRAISVDGEIVRTFDPNVHEEVPEQNTDGLIEKTQIDRRWVKVRRPTIVVGGELTMENLEVMFNPSTGICEAPVQLKGNCGTLVVDDFGRQKMSIDSLLNRWIVPLEKRYDILNMPNGKKVQVPFDELVIFATNLQPKDLVDEAFLRRIPYKIEITNPTEEEFINLFRMMCPKLGFEFNEERVRWLIDTHYTPNGRPMRSCQPRDLLQQVRNHCAYHKIPAELRPEFLDIAVENYFSIM